MTQIKTDDVTLHLPPPWPEDYRFVELRRGAVYLGLGFTRPREPGDPAHDHEVQAFGPGVLRWPIDLDADRLVARGPYPSVEAARQAAWSDSAEIRRAARDDGTDDRRRARRVGELHRCAACQATYRGDVSPALVLRPDDYVEIEDEAGDVAFAGVAEDWAPRVAQVVVTRAKVAIERMGREASALAEARQGAGYAAGVVVGAGTLVALMLVSDVGWMLLGWEPRAPTWSSIAAGVACLLAFGFAPFGVERGHRGQVFAALKIVGIVAAARLAAGLIVEGWS